MGPGWWPVEEPYRSTSASGFGSGLIVEDEAGEEQNLGVMPTAQAMRMAEEQLDLVEVAPQAQLPVCKIMDYGRFKYSMERKAREAKRAGAAGRAASEMKDVQLSRIDEHDRDFKVERARGFLTEGHPVRLVVRFLGRDMRHPEVGMKALQDALECWATSPHQRRSAAPHGGPAALRPRPPRQGGQAPREGRAESEANGVAEQSDPSPARGPRVAQPKREGRGPGACGRLGARSGGFLIPARQAPRSVP